MYPLSQQFLIKDQSHKTYFTDKIVQRHMIQKILIDGEAFEQFYNASMIVHFFKSLTVKQSIEKGGTCRLIPGLLNLSYEGRSIYRSKVLNNLFLTLSCRFSNNLHS